MKPSIDQQCLLCRHIKKYAGEKHICRKCYRRINASEYFFEKVIAYKLASYGLKCIPQYNDGRKSVDICIKSSKLYIEVDGSHHQRNPQITIDIWRDFYSDKEGFFTIRVPNSIFESKKGFLRVTRMIWAIARQRQKKWWQFWK